MSARAELNGGASSAAASLVTVRVEDVIDPTLTGRVGGTYESPPQPREQAMALVGLLLGGQSEKPVRSRGGEAAIAGGRRTVTLKRV